MTERKNLSETAYQHRTDGIEEKLQLLSEAHRLGKIDLAMSLSESIKDTLAFERQVREPEIDYAPGLERTGQVSHLPQSWLSTPVSPKNHRLGEWSFYKVIAVREHCGLDRRQEPVNVAIRFEHIQDPRREVRVAHCAHLSGVSEPPAAAAGRSGTLRGRMRMRTWRRYGKRKRTL